MKKRCTTAFCAILFAMMIMTAADTKAAIQTAWDADKTEVQTDGVFTYYIHPSRDGQEAWIYKIEIKGKKVKSLSIPAAIRDKKVTRLGYPAREIEDDNEAYVTLFGECIEPWHNADGSSKAVSFLTSVQLPDTVEVIDESAFSGLGSLTKIKLPKNVKKIEDYTFYGCGKLKTIVLPEQLESFQNSSLCDCPSLKNIKLSKTNKTFRVKGKCLIRKEDKALVFAATGGKKITIPNGVKKITSYAFGSTKSSVIHIPASVSEMERGVFSRASCGENIHIKNVTVSKGNRTFARDGQCIYKKSDKSLAVAIPDKKGELRISERVKKLTPDISVVNCDMVKKNLKKVVYPSSLKRVIVPGFGRFDADEVYFTGSVPPKVIKPKSAAGYAKLPIFCHVYVPKAYEDVYKSWYKKNKCYSSVTMWKGWHTYNP